MTASAPPVSKKPRNNLAASKKGAYTRHQSKHRHFINQDHELYTAEAGRYHLHVALACPWACGTLATLFLKGLDHAISYSIVHPTWGKTKPDDDADRHFGWVYRNPGDEPMSNPLGHGSIQCDDALIPDDITKVKSIRDIYALAGDHEGPFTTPVLWDKKTNTIVNNESTEILKMLNSEFNEYAKNNVDLYPQEFETELIKLNNSMIYPKVNNGVYRSGFARSQEAYEQAVMDVFATLEVLEQRLSKQRYLAGDKFTWLDLRLFMTLVRFDPVYVTYFKTNEKRIADYPNLLGYVRDIYSNESIKRSINMDHIKTHYFTSHPHLNTFGIIPIHNGPDLDVPHGRDKLFA